jgi:hypothetical protein
VHLESMALAGLVPHSVTTCLTHHRLCPVPPWHQSSLAISPILCLVQSVCNCVPPSLWQPDNLMHPTILSSVHVSLSFGMNSPGIAFIAHPSHSPVLTKLVGTRPSGIPRLASVLSFGHETRLKGPVAAYRQDNTQNMFQTMWAMYND